MIEEERVGQRLTTVPLPSPPGKKLVLTDTRLLVTTKRKVGWPPRRSIMLRVDERDTLLGALGGKDDSFGVSCWKARGLPGSQRYAPSRREASEKKLARSFQPWESGKQATRRSSIVGDEAGGLADVGKSLSFDQFQ